MSPPVGVVNAVGLLRRGLLRLSRELVPGNVNLLDLGTGAWVTQMLFVAATLGIPDQLGSGPRRSSEVARAVGADPDATHRLMRAMASKGVLRHRRDGTFALTRTGKALRTGTPGSLRDMMLFTAHPSRWQDWGDLLQAVRSGRTAPMNLRGVPFFEYLDSDPDLAATFNDAMTAMSALTNDAVLDGCDVGDARLIVDIGGGHGSFLASVLRKAHAARGILYDRESVVAQAEPTLSATDVGGRCAVEAGSFFDAVPAGADVYLLRNIIHDWNDPEALTILRNVRASIADGGRLLLVEMVLPERATPHFAQLLDLEMLVAVGGRERTRDGYANLLQQAGFQLQRVTPTVSPMSVIEARPV